MIRIATSGGYDPLHIGHIDCFEKAKKLGNWLIVIVNDDEFLKRKKGYAFMPLVERMKIILSLRMVDEVVASIDTDDLVCETLRLVKPDIFVKSKNWNDHNIPKPMRQTCKDIGCRISFVKTKYPLQSSSKILKEACRNVVF